MRRDLLLIVSLLVAVGAAQAAPEGDEPYIIGEEDDAKPTPPPVEHVAVERLWTRQYTERFVVSEVSVAPHGGEVVALTPTARQGPRAWKRDGSEVQLPRITGEAVSVALSTRHDLLAVAIAPDVLGGREGGVMLMDLESGRVERSLPDGVDARRLIFGPDDRYLAAALPDGVRVGDLDERDSLPLLPGTRDVVTLRFSADQVLFAGVPSGDRILELDLGDSERDRTWSAPGIQGPSAFSPRAELLAVGVREGLKIYKLVGEQSGPQLVTFSAPVTSVDWSASGDLIVVGTDKGEVHALGVRGVKGVSMADTVKLRRRAGDEANVQRQGGYSERDDERQRDDEWQRDDKRQRDDERQRDDKRQRDGYSERDSERQREEGRRRSDTHPREESSGYLDPRLAPGVGRDDSRGSARTRPGSLGSKVAVEYSVRVLEQLSGDVRTAESLQEALEDNTKRLAVCWRKERRKGGLQGDLEIQLTITADGEGVAPEKPSVDTIHNERVTDCIEEKLRDDVFQTGLGSADVRVVFRFHQVR